MKSTTFAVAAMSLLHLVSAQPHRRRHVHEHKIVKKDGDVVVTVIDTVYAEATEVPQVIVYVDQNGEPLSTVTEGLVVPQTTTATPGPSTVSISAAPYVAPVVENVENVQNGKVAASSKVAEAPVAAPIASTPAPITRADEISTLSSYPSSPSGGSNGFGLVYSPYKADGTCKSLEEVQTDFASVGKEYTLVRTYGTDCNQVTNVLSVVKSRGIKLFAGIFDISDLTSEVATIVAAANGDWTHFDTISVGNELVNSGAASASTVVAAIGTVRGLLKAAKYTGKVVTVDTLVAARANPSLCDASDFCAVNCHPFFDGNVAAGDSGSFLTTQIPTLKNVLANKNQDIIITETGWPWKGASNGAAVPSLNNQASALSSIKSSFSSNPGSIILFTAFNDMWKKNTAQQFEAEQFWGMGGVNAPSG